MSVANFRSCFIHSWSVILLLTITGGDCCGKPGSPYEGRVQTAKLQYNVGDEVRYICNAETDSVVGHQVRQCLSNETWGNPIPTCEENVALGKQVTGAGQEVVDNDKETHSGFSNGPSITVDLEQDFQISYVILTLNQHVKYSLKIEVINSQTRRTQPCVVITKEILDNKDNKFVCNNGTPLRGSQVKITDLSTESSNPIYEIGVFLYTDNSKCGQPDGPKHGSVQVLNNEARYSCEDSYSLDALPISQCVRGQWIPGNQICIRKLDKLLGCGEPGLPYNGDRNIERVLENESTYFCNKGATLVGESVRKCQPEGVWSPQDIPKCVTNIAYHKMAQLRKNEKPKLNSESVDGDDGTCELQIGQMYGYIDLGEPIYFDKGTILVKSNNMMTVTVYVTNSTDVTQTSFNDQSVLKDFCRIDNVRPTKPLKCNHDEVARFVVIYLNSAAQVCEVSIYNSKEKTPCGQPDQPLNGQMMMRNLKLTTYQCNPGFKLIGSSITKCVDGSWQSPPPRCIPETTTSAESEDDTTSSDKHTDESVAMGVMGIAVGVTAACLAIILVSVLVYCFVRKHYKNRNRCDHDHSSRGSRSDRSECYTTTFRLPELRSGDGDDVSIHLYDSIKEPEPMFSPKRLRLQSDVFDAGTLTSNNSSGRRQQMLPPRPPLYDTVAPELDVVPIDDRIRTTLPRPDDPLLDCGAHPRTSL